MLSTPKQFADVSVGDSFSFIRDFSEQDVAAFAALSGDTNPLHLDEAYAAATTYGKRLVHDMLVGVHLPGGNCVYLSQTLEFKKPVFIGEALTVLGMIAEKNAATRTLQITCFVRKESGEEAVAGTAFVRMLS